VLIRDFGQWIEPAARPTRKNDPLHLSSLCWISATGETPLQDHELRKPSQRSPWHYSPKESITVK
jgi:hypothetical protein